MSDDVAVRLQAVEIQLATLTATIRGWRETADVVCCACTESVKRHDEAIRGNGKPGIEKRLAHLEDEAKRRARWSLVVIGSLATVAAKALVDMVAR